MPSARRLQDLYLITLAQRVTERLQARACTCSTGAQTGRSLAGVTSVRRGPQLRPRSVETDHTISCDAEPSYHTSAACDAPRARQRRTSSASPATLVKTLRCHVYRLPLIYAANGCQKRGGVVCFGYPLCSFPPSSCDRPLVVTSLAPVLLPYLSLSFSTTPAFSCMQPQAGKPAKQLPRR